VENEELIWNRKEKKTRKWNDFVWNEDLIKKQEEIIRKERNR